MEIIKPGIAQKKEPKPSVQLKCKNCTCEFHILIAEAMPCIGLNPRKNYRKYACPTCEKFVVFEEL
jgi:hypothetical protein